MNLLRSFAAPLALIAIGLVLTLTADMIPGWMRFVTQLALSVGLASLGVMIMMRSHLVSFGQGLYYGVGAYTAALAGRYWGVQDAFLVVGLGILAAVAMAAVVGLIISRYREIFFAMLTLALSMIAYGVVLKMSVLGGSDGISVGAVTFAGYRPSGSAIQLSRFVFCCWITIAVAVLIHFYLRSGLGRLADAVRDNEVRLEYLGLSVRRIVYLEYLLAAACAGAGGVLAAISTRHVNPELVYWTMSGEFVFAAILGGTANVFAPLIGALFLEFLRSFAAENMPHAWQLILGSMMLVIIMFLPRGLTSIVGKLRGKAVP
ncbi:MAG: branched-chain amino acid ABC transporter permease [Pseudorhodoplanes sp.]|uniref:branched-chain amino acid ABC transporter permease n=1 Tax=Pseudorhodoplanes sp. TaxID=1934341 RepID=UPI003D0F8A8D